MTWTAENLARAFHEAYRRVSPKFYGTKAQAPSWEEINEWSRQHLIAVCRDVLGEPQVTLFATGQAAMKERLECEAPRSQEVVEVEKVPTSQEFEKAKAATRENESAEDALSDWEAELRAQIDSVSATSLRRAFQDAEEPFRK